MNPKFIFILLIGLAFSACRKDQIVPPEEPELVIQSYDTVLTDLSLNDTIHPSEYLMCYPGSWWEYSDGTTETSKKWKLVDQYDLTTIDSTIYITKTSNILPQSSN